MSRRGLLPLLLIAALIVAGGWLAQPGLAKKRGKAANQITVCAAGCQFTTLQDAVNASHSGDTILVKSGQPLVGMTRVPFREELTIDGDGQNQSILDGGDEGTVLFLNGGNYTIKDVTIRNGNANFGGGIDLDGGTLTLINSVVTLNQAIDGGGIYSVGSKVTIQNSDIYANEATGRAPDGNGGGLYNHGEFSIVTIQGSEIKGNRAGACGGGLFTDTTAINLVNTDVNDNAARTNGGGFCTTNNQPAILSSGSTVERNTPDDCFPAGSCIPASALQQAARARQTRHGRHGR